MASEARIAELEKRKRIAELEAKRSFAERASELDPTGLSVARAKNDAFGDFLRAQAAQLVEGETSEQRDVRLGGDLRPEAPGVGEGMLRAGFQGATFGFGDEAVAAGAAGLDVLRGEELGPAHEQRLAQERQKLSQFRESNPALALGTEIAGAVPTALAAPAVRAAQGAALGTRAVAGAGTAAGQAAVFGAGIGEGGAGSRAESALKTAAIAAPLGAAAPVVGNVAGNVVNRVRTGRAAQQAGVSRPAFETLERVTGADEALVGPGADRIAAAGPTGMVADAGPASAGLLDAVVARGGAPGTQALAAVEQRAAATAPAINQALDTAFGRPVGLRTITRNLRQGTATARNDAYTAAYERPINYATETGKDIERLIADRVPASAIAKANALMRAEGLKSNQILIRRGADGSVEFTRLPDVRQIDFITRGLNEVADAQNAKGKLGGTTQLGRAFGNLSRELRSLTRQAVPEYGVALDTAAEPILARNAALLGQKATTGKITRDELADELQGMSQAELSYVAAGIRGRIDEQLSNVRRILTDSNLDARESIQAVKELSSRATREKIELVIGPERAAQLFGTLDQATQALGLRASVAANSRTFARTAIDQSIKAQTEEGALNALRSGEPVNAARRLAQVIGGRTEGAKERIADATRQELVDVLVNRQGPQAAQTLQNMALARQGVGPATEQARSLAELLARSQAAPSGAQIAR